MSNIFTRPVSEFRVFVDERPTVCKVLLDCWEPIQRIFGIGTEIHISLEEDPEGNRCIHVDIQWSGDYTRGRDLLDMFDEEFWLGKVRDVASELMFDIELVKC